MHSDSFIVKFHNWYKKNMWKASKLEKNNLSTSFLSKQLHVRCASFIMPCCIAHPQKKQSICCFCGHYKCCDPVDGCKSKISHLPIKRSLKRDLKHCALHLHACDVVCVWMMILVVRRWLNLFCCFFLMILLMLMMIVKQAHGMVTLIMIFQFHVSTLVSFRLHNFVWHMTTIGLTSACKTTFSSFSFMCQCDIRTSFRVTLKIMHVLTWSD